MHSFAAEHGLKPSLEAWTEGIDFKEIISRIQCPTLIVHGEKDDLVLPANAHAIIGLVRGEKQLRIVPGGDHMCTHALADDVGPFIFNWLSEQLVALLMLRQTK